MKRLSKLKQSATKQMISHPVSQFHIRLDLLANIFLLHLQTLILVNVT